MLINYAVPCLSSPVIGDTHTVPYLPIDEPIDHTLLSPCSLGVYAPSSPSHPAMKHLVVPLLLRVLNIHISMSISVSISRAVSSPTLLLQHALDGKICILQVLLVHNVEFSMRRREDAMDALDDVIVGGRKRLLELCAVLQRSMRMRSWVPSYGMP